MRRRRRKPRGFLKKAIIGLITFLVPWTLIRDEFTEFWKRQGCVIATQVTFAESKILDTLITLKICDNVLGHSTGKGSSYRPGRSHAPYERSQFGVGWEQGTIGCMNKRMSVLKETSTVRVRTSNSGCSVIHGRWRDPYTNMVFFDAHNLDIDHVVPLSFAWQHGAAQWSQSKRESFANDSRNLIPVQNSANRSKSDKSPLEWLPPNRSYRCKYTKKFADVMRVYGLSWSSDEARQFAAVQKNICG